MNVSYPDKFVNSFKFAIASTKLNLEESQLSFINIENNSKKSFLDKCAESFDKFAESSIFINFP